MDNDHLNLKGVESSVMSNSEETGSPGWSASLFLQTTEDVARAVAAAASAATTARSPRPSVVFSSKDENCGSPLQKLQRRVTKVLKGFSTPPEVKSVTYNPEILTSQKRQWASFQLQSLDHRPLKEPSRIFESMVVVGLHPNCDIQALEKQYFGRKSEGSGKFRSTFSGQHQSRVEPNLEPQVLFVYPPEQPLPLKYKDLLSFCFPGGVEVHAIEKTPSMSELNEIFLGQECLKKNDLSFVFRLQVADDSTLYGCCVLVEEVVQKRTGLISMISDVQSYRSGLSRHILTTRRCYCILSRLPFFELHFGVLKSIFTEERLERLTKGIMYFALGSAEEYDSEEILEENSYGISVEHRENNMVNGTEDASLTSLHDSMPQDACQMKHQNIDNDSELLKKDMNDAVIVPTELEDKGKCGITSAVHLAMEKLEDKEECGITSTSEIMNASEISEACDPLVDDSDQKVSDDSQLLKKDMNEGGIALVDLTIEKLEDKGEYGITSTSEISEVDASDQKLNPGLAIEKFEDGGGCGTSSTSEISEACDTLFIDSDQNLDNDSQLLKKDLNDCATVPVDPAIQKLEDKGECGITSTSGASETCDTFVDDLVTNGQETEKCLPNAVLPPIRFHRYESSESSSSLQGSPCEDRTCRSRSDLDEGEIEEASFSGQEYTNDHSEILEWAKENDHGSLQIISQYYQLCCPARGSTIKFHPLEHLYPLEFHRPDETVLHIAGSRIDLKSCSSSLELAEAHTALMAEEEATALSVWATSCLCGTLRLDHVLTLFAGALLEKQILIVSSNLGVLSALVLSIIPLIRPYQWQSLLMPVLPNDMLDFLDAPVPYVVGVKNKTIEVQSKLTNVILVDANKNQVRCPTIPVLPRRHELYTSLSPFHAKLVGESFLARKRPVYECTDVQVQAAKGFLEVLRSYLDSLCYNLRSHTITNVQSNDDKVSLLLKESFIESFPSRDRPFMKHFVDTQLFSVHTDLVLSFFQKE
ncbi:hypothetical protein NMG60_11013649 [Bertholletia excelsa]